MNLFCRLFHWPWHTKVITTCGNSESTEICSKTHYKCYKCNRLSRMEETYMKAYHKGDSRPLQDRIDELRTTKP